MLTEFETKQQKKNHMETGHFIKNTNILQEVAAF